MDYCALDYGELQYSQYTWGRSRNERGCVDSGEKTSRTRSRRNEGRPAENSRFPDDLIETVVRTRHSGASCRRSIQSRPPFPETAGYAYGEDSVNSSRR